MLLLFLLAWLSFSKRRIKPEMTFDAQQEREWRHISYLGYITQALASTDIEFIKARGFAALAKRVEKERRLIALEYLQALRRDFENLVDFARVVAVMSPNVELTQELQGLRLQLAFSCRYYLIHARLSLGIAPRNAFGNLSHILSALTVRMEAAISELGERAALGAELSSHNNGGAS
ncbi:MAG: hypothetical protein M3P45_16390 [Acidobacteriota bacterium]|nr:hypothetical protein [Acidobacteriota bacterium]